MAFSAAELHVLRRSLAHALQSSPAPLTAAEVQGCLRLAQSVDEAVREAARLRAFLLEDLARYRGALPGSLTGYLELLQDALAAGYEPTPDDLAALRALRAGPVAAALLDRAQALAERSVRRRLSTTPAPRTRLLALAGGREERPEPSPAPEPAPAPTPEPGQPAKPGQPARPVPTPGEVFPPRRKPGPPPAAGRAAG
ncbi:hypothetical protein AMK16_19795 [Streptomyces sp. CB00455]|uniref:hypothetical protein n=1 Tax=Streptomyces sp. CB00455 TaxID=1703927 RepID=UPI00093F7A80|nr:hypothetical protein [Streptomyces sp. CB00455]OKK18526.1 hypothetical protein AMK16_19795 [Streptomyces sp. CB00455]